MLALLGVIFLIFAVRAHPTGALALVLVGALIYFTGFWIAAALLIGGFAVLVLLIARHDAKMDWPTRWN